MPNSRQILPIAVGLSFCGFCAYFAYRYWKKEDDDDYEENIPKKSRLTTFELRVPRHAIPSLKGPRGDTIKSIQNESGCRITFTDDDPNETERTCIIRGDAESIRLAKKIISDIITSLDSIKTEEMYVPSSVCGRLIGTSGRHIVEMMRDSNTKITIEKQDSLSSSASRKVTIKGTDEQIAVAKSLIEAKVNDVLEMRNTLSQRQPRGKPIPKNLNADSNSIYTKPVQVVNEKLAESGQSDGQIEVYVSAVEDPSKFWVQIVGTKATELDQLVDQMTEYYCNSQNAEQHKLQEFSVGEIVAAMFHFDRKIYRAEIIDIKNESVGSTNKKSLNVYYVDYGDTNWVEETDVFELRTDFLRLRFQAIECFLASVEPVGNQWTEEATDLFESITQVAQWKKMWSKIVCYKERDSNKAESRIRREGSPIPGIELYDNTKDGDVNVAEELVKNGFATHQKDEQEKTTNGQHSGRASSEGRNSGIIFASTPNPKKAQTVLVKLDETNNTTIENSSDTNSNSTFIVSNVSDKTGIASPSSSNVKLTYHTADEGSTVNSSSTFIGQETNSSFNGNSTYSNGNLESDLNENSNLAGGDFSSRKPIKK